MPRIARQKSCTDVYHIILRGINKQDIFFDDMDRRKFLNELNDSKEKYKFNIYAYCLMDNHIHIMIKDNNKQINKIMQSIAITYAMYFNRKYNRIGHLFSNRYNSRVVEDVYYILSLQRYIHQNPEKAGIAKTNKYEWSSYNDYIEGSQLVDRHFILNILSDNIEKAIQEFKKMNERPLVLENVNDILEYEMVTKITDNEARRLIELKIGKDNFLNLDKYNSKIRNNFLKKILEIKGMSYLQTSRVTGINRKILERLNKGMQKNGQNVP